MAYRRFKVLKELKIGYGSHVHAPTPTHSKRHQPGTILHLQSEAFNGNVWFVDPDGERGKIECGQVSNLTSNGRVVELSKDDVESS